MRLRTHNRSASGHRQHGMHLLLGGRRRSAKCELQCFLNRVEESQMSRLLEGPPQRKDFRLLIQLAYSAADLTPPLAQRHPFCACLSLRVLPAARHARDAHEDQQQRRDQNDADHNRNLLRHADPLTAVRVVYHDIHNRRTMKREEKPLEQESYAE